jgi:hypothetical protein
MEVSMTANALGAASLADSLPNCAMRQLVGMAQAIMEGRGQSIEWNLMQLFAWEGRFDYTPTTANADVFFPASLRRN